MNLCQPFGCISFCAQAATRIGDTMKQKNDRMGMTMTATKEQLLDLGGKSALVTGASQGIGMAAAQRLALCGADVLMASRRLDAVTAAAAEIDALAPGRVSGAAADIARAEDIGRLYEHVDTALGGLDLLVISGGGPRSASFSELGDADWQTAFDLLLMSTVRLIRHAVPRMQARGGGRIVVVLSSGVKQPIPGLMLSNSLRAAVTGLIQTLSVELARDNILINGALPGRIDTERVASLDQLNAGRQRLPVEEVRRRSQQSIPLGRYGQPHEMADAILFLCSPMATYVTGSLLEIDGGMVRTLL